MELFPAAAAPPSPKPKALLNELVGTARQILWSDWNSDTIGNGDEGDEPTGAFIIRVQELAAPHAEQVVKGNCVEGEIEIGMAYRFLGKWVDHHKYGKQFQSNTFVKHEPATRAGVVRYLVKLCDRVGEARAGRLFDAFGPEAVSILRTTPQRVVEAGILSKEAAIDAADSLTAVSALEATKIDLYSLFDRRGFPGKLLPACIARWKAKAGERIRRDPFTLLVNEMPGCGFKRCDKMYLDLGHNPSAVKRQMLAAWHAIREDSTGHTWFPLGFVHEAVRKSIPGDKADPKRAVALGVRAGWLIPREHPAGSNSWWIGEASKVRNEMTIGSCIQPATTGTVNLWSAAPDEISCEPAISDHQRSTLRLSLRGPIGILGGTPGCLSGDTRLIYLRGKRNGGREISLHDFYCKFNGIKCGTTPWSDLSEPTFLHSLSPAGEVFYNRVIAVLDSGIKETVCIQFSDGSSLRLTRDHPIATPTGEFMKVEDLSIGDTVLAKGSMKPVFCGGKNLADRPPRVVVNTRFHPHGSKKIVVCNGVAYHYRRELRARLVVEANMNGVGYEEYVECLKNEQAKSASFAFLPRNVEVHHRDEDTLNDSIENLELLPKADHARAHSKRENFHVEYTREVRVVSIGQPKLERTFDIQMESPANNFCANGVIVHNTGKTFTAAQVIAWIVFKFGIGAVAVCAPTGKAAVRVSTAMRQYGLLVSATTIHRLLRVGRTRGPNGSSSFIHGHSNPLPVKFVVVDEASMLDTDLTAALLSACAPGTHVLFVGDPYQLPPVGHGAPLRDMIAAGVPAGELTEIRRNAGMIVHACKAIKEAVPFVTTDRYDPDTGANFKHIEAARPGEPLDWLKKVLSKFRESGKFDAVWDVQVLVAVNKRSEVSRNELNRELQGLLNPTGKTSPLNAFRTGDKIICLKNNGQIPLMELISARHPGDSISSYRQLVLPDFIANGEIGSVLAVAPKLTVAKFSNPDRIVRISSAAPTKWKQRDGDNGAEANAGEAPKLDEDQGTETSTGCDFDLAYACTCHKLQGSEAPVVIVMVDDSGGAKWVCSREWVYTAISRASKLCITIGKRQVLDGHCKRVNLQRRKTFLKEMLAEGR